MRRLYCSYALVILQLCISYISGVFQFTEELTDAGEYTIAFAVTNSGDTALNSALFLDNGTSLCEPNCNEEGSPENPLLPEEVVIRYLMMTAKLHFQPVKSTTRRIIQLC